MKTTFKNFLISSEYIGNKAWPADAKHQNYNNHIVKVKDKITGKSTKFEFWASIMNPEIQTTKKLLSAFSCFVSDAISGKETFEYFCSEFGYDEDSRNAERIYKACVKSLGKLERITDYDLYDLSNDLNELENA